MPRMRCFAILPLLAGMALSAPAARAAEKYELKIPAGLPALKAPSSNPLTAEKIELGKQLYFDPRMSSDDTISCSSCHDPKKGWSNGEQFATGVGGQKGGRNSPTIINAGYFYFQFWDGRAVRLEGQALGPIQNPIEMNMSLEAVVKKLNAIEGYRSQFQKVFGTDVTSEGIAKSLAAFELTILSGDAPYDRFMAGDKTALSASAQRGLDLFNNKAKCSACHPGPKFTDGAFHNLGVGIHGKDADLGRFVVTKVDGDKGSFKTPGLRDIAKSAPYMHDGSHKTLKEVVEYYNQGGTQNDQLDEEIFPLSLTDQEIDDLTTFLEEGLSSSKYPMVEPPKLPE